MSLQRFATSTSEIAWQTVSAATPLGGQVTKHMKPYMQLHENPRQLGHHDNCIELEDALQEAYGNSTTPRSMLERLHLDARPQVLGALLTDLCLDCDGGLHSFGGEFGIDVPHYIKSTYMLSLTAGSAQSEIHAGLTVTELRYSDLHSSAACRIGSL